MSEEWLVALAPHRLLQARRALVYGMVDAGHCSCGFGWPAAAAATLQLRPAFGTAAQLHAGKSEEGRACAEHDHGAKGGGWAHGTFPPARGRSGACQGAARAVSAEEGAIQRTTRADLRHESPV